MSAPVVALLSAAVPAALVTDDPAVVASHEVDWTGRYRGCSTALVRPRNVDDVAAVLAVCSAEGLAVVPQGGNTGLVGGAVPADGAVLLSLRGLRATASVDPLEATASASAGTTVAEVQEAAARAGLRYGIDLASRDSATIGGTVATNAGGLRVLGLGDTRAQLLGYEAVLAGGQVLSHLGALRKDNTGYAIGQLMCGSEGTLGVVTAVSVRLHPRPNGAATALLGFADLAAAVEAAGVLRTVVPGLEALEMMQRDGVELVRAQLGVAEPGVPGAVLLLAEATGSTALADLAAGVAGCAQVVGEAVADDPAGRARLWALRERHTEAIARVGIAHKLDVTLPLAALPAAAAEVVERISALRPEASVWLFGHIGDGNVHVNITGVSPDDEAVDDVVLRVVAAHGGSISAEHGIGRMRRRWLHLNRTPAELAAFASIKAALDPAGLLNPGVLLP